jgi:hypothetical protein
MFSTNVMFGFAMYLVCVTYPAIPMLRDLITAVRNINYEAHYLLHSSVWNRPVTLRKDAGLRISSI